MKIVEFYKEPETTLSLEIFPPKADYPLETIFNTIEALKGLSPKFISVTYGAGGSTRDRTVEIASHIKKEYQIETLAHLTCTAHSKQEVDSILEQLLALEIDNIMALRGDPPADKEETCLKEPEYNYAVELIKDARKKADFGIGAAAYPEGHPESSRLSDDLFYLKQKVYAGADFLVTQFFFDNRKYLDFVERCLGIGINCPIIPGIMPVLNAGQIRRMLYLSGASLPSELLRLLDKYENKPEDMEKAGIEYASQQVENLLRNQVLGVHLYTMNKPRQIQEIVKNTM